MDGGRTEFTFFWFVESYSYCWHENGEVLYSPQFTADGPEGTAWKLGLYPRGWRGKDKGFVSLYLYRSADDDGPNLTSVKFELSVLAADGSPLSSAEFNYSFKRRHGCGWQRFVGTNEILLQRKADYLPRDILTVRCKICRGEGNVHSVAPVCARTRIGVENISYLHVVENFSRLESRQKNTVEIRSHSEKESFASSSLYFTPDSKIIVEITPFDSTYVPCKLKMSLLGSGKMIECGEDDNRFDVERKDIGKLPLSLAMNTILAQKSEYLPDDRLTLLCECCFSTGLEFEKIEETPAAAAKRTNVQKLSKNDDSPAVKASANTSGVSEDMKALYINKYLTDVELKTKTKSFPAHKIMLCLRSPVFERMLASEMKEKNNDFIQVVDLRDDVVQQLLIFLYSDTVENLQWETARQLFYAADKYQVGKLKEVCTSYLVTNLTPNNAVELLLLADTQNDSELKKVVENFILEHEKMVFVSKEWEMLMETNPMLVMKTMQLKYKR